MVTDIKQVILTNMRAEHIPAKSSGLWYIQKAKVDTSSFLDKKGYLPSGVYTHLFRLTTATLHKEPPGEVVMEDTPFELSKHLNFVLKASGSVLVTGLGLGCVVRGLLSNPAVEHVTCIEKSNDVLRLVKPFMLHKRLAIIHADALEWTIDNPLRFDYAWHDLWTARDEGEPHLDEWHLRLILNCSRMVGVQGAWAFNRDIRRGLRSHGLQII